MMTFNRYIPTKIYKLVAKTTGDEIKVGDIVTTIRNETYVVRGFIPPRHEASTGRVELEPIDNPNTTGLYFPTVIDARIVEIDPPTARQTLAIDKIETQILIAALELYHLQIDVTPDIDKRSEALSEQLTQMLRTYND